jgi:hypothetical protein
MHTNSISIRFPKPISFAGRRKLKTIIQPSFLAIVTFLLFGGIFLSLSTFAQRKKETKAMDTLKSGDFSGLKFRSIGPAFSSGRIADFAVNPKHPEEYFVAVASGHIWKTTTSGTTWEPIFDNYGAYSIGCLAMDPENTSVIWAGTGENNHQRCLGYGDGVYKTINGGKSWENMGLKDSRQIGMIAIDPRNMWLPKVQPGALAASADSIKPPTAGKPGIRRLKSAKIRG